MNKQQEIEYWFAEKLQNLETNKNVPIFARKNVLDNLVRNLDSLFENNQEKSQIQKLNNLHLGKSQSQNLPKRIETKKQSNLTENASNLGQSSQTIISQTIIQTSPEYLQKTLAKRMETEKLEKLQREKKENKTANLITTNLEKFKNLQINEPNSDKIPLQAGTETKINWQKSNAKIIIPKVERKIIPLAKMENINQKPVEKQKISQNENKQNLLINQEKISEIRLLDKFQSEDFKKINSDKTDIFLKTKIDFEINPKDKIEQKTLEKNQSAEKIFKNTEKTVISFGHFLPKNKEENLKEKDLPTKQIKQSLVQIPAKASKTTTEITNIKKTSFDLNKKTSPNSEKSTIISFAHLPIRPKNLLNILNNGENSQNKIQKIRTTKKINKKPENKNANLDKNSIKEEIPKNEIKLFIRHEINQKLQNLFQKNK